MPDTIQNIIIPQNQWVDLYALSGVAVGEQITVENTGDIDIYLCVQATQPATGANNYNILARKNGVRLQNNAGDAGAWAYCNGAEGKININQDLTQGFTVVIAQPDASPLPVTIDGPDPLPVEIDASIVLPVSIDSPNPLPVLIDEPLETVNHATVEILNGRAFYGTDVLRGVGNNDVVNWIMSIGSVEALINFSVKSIGNYEIEMYEDSATSNDGSVLQNFNFKRADTTTTIETRVYHDPNITNDGNLIVESLNYGGEKNSVTASDSDSSFLLKPNTKYVIRFTNTSGNAVDIAYSWKIIE